MFTEPTEFQPAVIPATYPKEKRPCFKERLKQFTDELKMLEAVCGVKKVTSPEGTALLLEVTEGITENEKETLIEKAYSLLLTRYKDLAIEVGIELDE
ncbi:hypothetical protein [Thermovibrio ammonificans]